MKKPEEVTREELNALSEKNCMNPFCRACDGFNLSEVKTGEGVDISAEFIRTVRKQCTMCAEHFDLHYSIGFSGGMSEPRMVLECISIDTPSGTRSAVVHSWQKETERK